MIVNLNNSPVTQHQFQGHDFHLKRDDLLHSHFNGNKARKFAELLETDLTNVTQLIGWGSAQANSLTSLAALAKIKGIKLKYFVDHKPEWLDLNPNGNYRAAKELGAEIVSLKELLGPKAPHPHAYIQANFANSTDSYIVPEGGRFQSARQGIVQLAEEILSWSRFEKNKQIKVALPSGTGTTALYLAQVLAPQGIEVITCPCVGGKDYLIQQFDELGNFSYYPTILELESKHHFGKLYLEDYEIWRLLQAETHIEFDLLYDPMMWRCLLPWLSDNPDVSLLYIHQGGILGNETMLPRYRRKYDAPKNEW